MKTSLGFSLRESDRQTIRAPGPELGDAELADDRRLTLFMLFLVTNGVFGFLFLYELDRRSLGHSSLWIG